jgi:hypothetical protein
MMYPMHAPEIMEKLWLMMDVVAILLILFALCMAYIDNLMKKNKSKKFDKYGN